MTEPAERERNSGRRSRRMWLGLVATLVLSITAIVLVALWHDRGQQRSRAVLTARPPRPADLFTTIPRDTLPIAWREWSRLTFVESRDRTRPVVALLDVAWSESCALYAAALATDTRARAALESSVLALHVDADRRPDIQARFCLENSALPTWIFFAPGGHTWEVMDALPPDGLVRRIAELSQAPHDTRPDPGIEMLRRLLPVRPATPDLQPIPERIFAALQSEWPAAGVPLGPDSPLLEFDALEFVRAYAEFHESAAIRALYFDMVRRLAAGVDSTGSVLQEVMPVAGRIMRGRFLATHAMLLDHFSMVAASRGDDACEAAARRVAGWLETTLYEPRAGLFRGAQGTLVVQNGRPVLTSAERARMRGHDNMPAPQVVGFCPTHGNARAGAALQRFAGGDADAVRYRQLGASVLAKLAATIRDGHLPHDFELDAEGKARPANVDFLADYAELGLALLRPNAASPGGRPGDSDQVGHRADAAELANALLARFGGSESGAFFDIPPPDPDAPERMQVRLEPLADNARASLFLLELAQFSGDARARDAAIRALEAWSWSVRGQSPWPAALYGTAVLAALRTRAE